jgi:hypothetical protein
MDNKDKADIDRILEGSVRAATAVLEKYGEVKGPIFAIFQTDGNLLPIMAPIGVKDEQLQKQLIAAFIRAKLREEQAVGYTVVSEAWMAIDSAGADKDEFLEQYDRDRRAGKRIADRPDRIDTLVVAAVTPTQQRVRMYEIKRPGGRYAGLTPRPENDLEDLKVEGLFMELYER